MNNVELIRPRVCELVYALYGRPLHPELFETLCSRTIRKPDFTLTARLTRTGHAFSWTTKHWHLTEVTAAVDEPLPLARRLLHHRLQGEHTDAWAQKTGIVYQMSSQVEKLEPEPFLQVHEELLADGAKRGLLYHFPPHCRLALSPLGYLTIESWNGCILLASFHTFPDELTVVKTQSLIERA